MRTDAIVRTQLMLSQAINSLADDVANAVTFTIATLASTTVNTTTLKLAQVAFASLPASPVVGMLACVNNSNTAVWGATIAGGGANKVLAFYNGTNWTVAGI